MSITKDALYVKAERVYCPANCKNDNRRRGSASLYPSGLTVCWSRGCPGPFGNGLPKTKDGKGTLWFTSNKEGLPVSAAVYSRGHLADMDDTFAGFFCRARAGDYLRYRPVVKWRNLNWCKENGRPYGGPCSIRNIAESNLLTVEKVQVAGASNQAMVIYRQRDTSKPGKGSLHTDCTDSIVDWFSMGYGKCTDLENQPENQPENEPDSEPENEYPNFVYIPPRYVERGPMPTFAESLAERKQRQEYDQTHVPKSVKAAYKSWQSGSGCLTWNAELGTEILELNNLLASAIYVADEYYPPTWYATWAECLPPCPTKYINKTEASIEYEKIESELLEIFLASDMNI